MNNKNIKYGLSEDELLIIKNIFSFYNSKIDKIGIFGSRANGNYKDYSDIDFVLYGKISQENINRLNTLFDESNLGIKVDIKAYQLLEYLPLKKHTDKVVRFLNF